jgi:outer membrane protein assembly factor BamB
LQRLLRRIKLWLTKTKGNFMILRIACALLLVSLVQAAPSWPQFRGPSGQGVADTTGVPSSWAEDKNVAWKTEIPGRGLSSPVIDGDQIWLTTAIDVPTPEADREERLKTNTGNQPLIVSDHVRLLAICIDRNSGKILHNIELMDEDKPQWVHQLNSYATPTPILRDGKLFCHFGTFGNACVDTQTGKVLWTNRELRAMHENGPGSTPELWGNRFLLVYDGSDTQFVAALDTDTGKIAWRTPRSGEMHDNPQLKKAYGSPLLIEHDGQPQLISPGANWLYAYDPASGRELWKHEYGLLGFSNVSRPVYANGVIYMCTGFMRGELQALRIEDGKVTILWRKKKGVGKQPSPLVVGERLYMMGDKDVITCLNAESGKELWQARLPGKYSASPTFIDGHIHVTNHEGLTTVFADADSYSELAKNQLDGRIMASPAVVDGALYMRTDKALYRISK